MSNLNFGLVFFALLLGIFRTLLAEIITRRNWQIVFGLLGVLALLNLFFVCLFIMESWFIQTSLAAEWIVMLFCTIWGIFLIHLLYGVLKTFSQEPLIIQGKAKFFRRHNKFQSLLRLEVSQENRSQLMEVGKRKASAIIGSVSMLELTNGPVEIQNLKVEYLAPLKVVINLATEQ